MLNLQTQYFAYGLGILVVYLIGTLIFNRKQCNTVLERLHIRRDRVSGTFTPPRSLSPEKQGLPPNKPSQGPDYGDVFPPSRRSALAELPSDALKGPGSSTAVLAAREPDYSKRVPDCEVGDTSELSDHVTATGFAVEEIKRLGDFPDYAALSDVPLPEAYTEFNINNALPRPFRPFRWAYHQTMCRLSRS